MREGEGERETGRTEIAWSSLLAQKLQDPTAESSTNVGARTRNMTTRLPIPPTSLMQPTTEKVINN